jgi:hypothetical protein
MILEATSSLRSTVFAIPRSSIVRPTTAAPYVRQRARMRWSRSPPSSKFTELTMALPEIRESASSTTGGSVESIMSGSVTCVFSRGMNSRISLDSSLPTKATQTSSRCAPSLACSFPIAVIASQSSAARRSRNFRLPFAFVRSPIRVGAGATRYGTWW